MKMVKMCLNILVALEIPLVEVAVNPGVAEARAARAARLADTKLLYISSFLFSKKKE